MGKRKTSIKKRMETIEVEIPNALYRKIVKSAEVEGMTVSEWASQAISRYMDEIKMGRENPLEMYSDAGDE